MCKVAAHNICCLIMRRRLPPRSYCRRRRPGRSRLKAPRCAGRSSRTAGLTERLAGWDRNEYDGKAGQQLRPFFMRETWVMSRRKRALLWAWLLVALTGVGLVGVQWAMTPTPGVTLENFRRLHDRMKMEEIEPILGGPAHDGWPPFTHEWTGEEGKIHLNAVPEKHRQIFIGYTGTFTTPDGKTFRVAAANESLLARLRRWLGL